jgi:hypothetical protein
MYKKRGRHDKDVKCVNNGEVQFATQFSNFFKKHPNIIISHVSIPQINLDIGTGFTLSSATSTTNNQKYPVDDIKEPTHCTLLYSIGRTLRTIKVVDAIVMASHIMDGQPIPSECAMVEVTTIR